MNDPLLVRGFERLGDLPRNRQRLDEGDGAERDAVRKRRSLDQLQHERACAVRLLEAVDGGDVRMVE